MKEVGKKMGEKMGEKTDEKVGEKVGVPANKVRTVFFGSPELAVPMLAMLAEQPQVQLVGVVSQPPRAVGRGGGKKRGGQQSGLVASRSGQQSGRERGFGRAVLACAVHREAESLGLSWCGDHEGLVEQLGRWGVELGIVCGYGRLLPRVVLDMARLGMFNLHFSLLPRWRGASPVQAALLAGDQESGVSLQLMQEKLDAGAVLAKIREKIGEDDDAIGLGTRLSQRATELLAGMLPTLVAGTGVGVPQRAEQVTWCATMKKEDGWIDFAKDEADLILRKLRAFRGWPGCSGWIKGHKLSFLSLEKILEKDRKNSSEESSENSSEESSEKNLLSAVGVLQADGRVQTRSGSIKLLRVQLAGARPLAWHEFIRGRSDFIGRSFLSQAERV